MPGLDVTVDYWDIDIKDVITQFTGNQIADYCVDLPNIDNIFCDAMTRDANDPMAGGIYDTIGRYFFVSANVKL